MVQNDQGSCQNSEPKLLGGPGVYFGLDTRPFPQRQGSEDRDASRSCSTQHNSIKLTHHRPDLHNVPGSQAVVGMQANTGPQEPQESWGLKVPGHFDVKVTEFLYINCPV